MPPKKKQKLERLKKLDKPTLHTCNKTSFAKAFLPNETYRQRLLDYIAIIHQLADHASHALKFYILSTSTSSFPVVHEDTIEAILYLLNKGEAWHPRKEAKKAWRDCLLPYVQRYCQIVGFIHPNLRGEQQSINYLTVSMMTNLKVNVQEHFMQMLLRYINLRFDVKGQKQRLPPKSDARKAFFTRLRYLKSVFLFDVVPELEFLDDLTPLESEVLEEIWSLDLPFLPNDPLAYAIVADPMSFFPAYCKLSGLYEQYGFQRFSAIPLRRSLIQSHVRIDTIILYQHILCITRRDAETVEKDDLWMRVCNLCTKAFRSRCGMHFEGSITTDGASVSVYLKHPEADKYGKRGARKSANTVAAEVKALYVENNLPACRAAENVVVIDPNKRDILYCQDSNGTTFRYTANQRAVETGSRRFAKRREAMKEEAGVDLIESRIPSHKTMNLMDFTRYLLVRRADWDRRKEFYSHPAHTRWKWHSFINRQKSESDLISNMRNKYGENFTVVMGDWSDAGRTARFQTSSKTKGWRTLFKRNRIDCFLLDEYKTSSVCPRCSSSEFVEKKFKTRPHSRPWRRREGKIEKVHGLLGCTNPNCLQQAWTSGMRYWNRDMLSTCNMLLIVRSMLDGHGRPEVFSRSVPAVA
ncbi:uncharacterized protein SPPG_07727 [Spizellomyces punctatus DAOM BR117]|uniref:Uncharacterized protein n=1 Tax=Spizellomyces punctatus (strain DAOM BR117) TaxID=645134 RepID=A0A0L0H5U9_SPIPD|nr:uncharacterized protein SPPG_07727 [Spizellomyces punctatus DAOM BR117]KNC96900.1 hypothetical protein SPPG_07727 [Spizellomyces punctatus DAOM BR117]|eukprot:XP_016604940.1 hypothetical protein SPPG_07727 [Spizellomyces punctatus DAOM BR117]